MMDLPGRESQADAGALPPAGLEKLRDNISGVLLGQQEAVHLALIALLADGHLLIEDVPGIGKTLLARALARSVEGTFHRIQFTPDLLPSDLIGTSVYHQASGEFVFKPGPLFAAIVLADEINRATPRTQSALLEAMSDRQVSVDGLTRPLGAPFMVIATQNPFEFEGTFPLPENQLDRFVMRVRFGYPDRQTEKQILAQHRQGEPIEHLSPVVTAAEVVSWQERVRKVHVADSLNDYLLDLVAGTRTHGELYLGASTRAALALYRAAQARAFLEKRDFVIPDDIKRLAASVLAHRLLLKSYRRAAHADRAEEIIAEILERTPLPATQR